jgi:predicted O-methyltransferase YrrM
MKLGHAIFELIQWMRHRWRSRMRHGVHSPFVFGLQDGALKDAAMQRIESLERIRQGFTTNYSTFDRTDLGAGSRTLATDRISIASFAQRSLQNEHAARILRGLAEAIDAQKILELGTSLGVTTAYLAWERPHRQVCTVEGDPYVLQTAREGWHTLGLEHIQSYCQDFSEFLATPENTAKTWDLVVVDGNHTYTATTSYWAQLKHRLNERGCIVFDDIYWSPDMTKAWREIVSDPSVTLVLDYFEFGVVFTFDRPQKEYFNLRMPTAKPRTRYY